ncbi:class E sortase [Nocardioides panacihumi]|uniref:Class E sortase n=1 Tax=Nocardioides panacihumi TaxID=400774 RepID=A0ABP5BNF0_9ACTN
MTRAHRRAPGRARTLSRVLIGGGALVVLGSGSVLAWQYAATDAIAHHEQRTELAAIERRWQTDSAIASTPTTAPVRVRTSERAIIRIPRFGKQYAVPIREGVGADVLADGFGHYPGAAAPGQVGNYAITAHRVTHGEPLRAMPELRPGDTVVVETATEVYTYVLDTGGDDLVVHKSAVWTIQPRPHNPSGGVQPPRAAGDRLITLTTCASLVHTDDRMIAFGHLLSTTRKS